MLCYPNGNFSPLPLHLLSLSLLLLPPIRTSFCAIVISSSRPCLLCCLLLRIRSPPLHLPQMVLIFPFFFSFFSSILSVLLCFVAEFFSLFSTLLNLLCSLFNRLPWAKAFFSFGCCYVLQSYYAPCFLCFLMCLVVLICDNLIV